MPMDDLDNLLERFVRFGMAGYDLRPASFDHAGTDERPLANDQRDEIEAQSQESADKSRNQESDYRPKHREAKSHSRPALVSPGDLARFSQASEPVMVTLPSR
jgi:hypothetical protein